MQKVNALKHWPFRQDNEPGSATVYVATCGHESADKKEFVDDRRHGMNEVTCQACKDRYSSKRKEQDNE